MTLRSARIAATLAPILVTALTLGIVAIPAHGQEPLPEGISQPNFEPSSSDTLMDRSDLGNVAQAARMQYDSGVRDLKKGQKLQDKAETMTDPKDKAKTEENAQSAFESADKAFREALSYNASFAGAYAGLGTALRLQGKAEEALQVHALALRRLPDDLENFAGWSESLLALNMLGNAVSAYTDYAQSNPARAEILMGAMERWLAEKKADAGEIDPADIQRLAEWVEQQEPS